MAKVLMLGFVRRLMAGSCRHTLFASGRTLFVPAWELRGIVRGGLGGRRIVAIATLLSVAVLVDRSRTRTDLYHRKPPLPRLCLHFRAPFRRSRRGRFVGRKPGRQGHGTRRVRRKLSGVYALHEELWKRRLEFNDYEDRLTLVYGDMKTTSFIRRIKQDQLEASDLWERKKWMLPVPALFHVELNYIELLFRKFWDTGSDGSFSSVTIFSDVQFFGRGRSIKKKDIKYHQPLLLHGFTSRILAFVINELVDRQCLDPETMTIEDISREMKKLTEKEEGEELDSMLEKI
jgi:hypothetical protein